MQSFIFGKILKVKYKFFEQNSTGYIVSRVHNEALTLQRVLWDFFVKVFTDVLMFLVGLYFIFKFNIKLAFISLALLPFFVLILKFFSKKIKAHSNSYQEEYSRLYGFFYEMINLIFLVKVLLLNNFANNKLEVKLDLLYKVKLKYNIVNTLFMSLIALIGALSPIIILYVGGLEIIAGRLSLGTLIAFNSFLGYIYGPTKNMLNYSAELISAVVAFNRIRDMLNVEKENNRKNVKLDNINNVTFKDVSFSYSTLPVLRNVTFEIKKGERVGIVGKIGSGKSTLMKLLMGLYDEYSGKILFNDIDIRNIESLTEKIGIIPQDNYLLSESIFENIRLGNLERGVDDIFKIVKRLELEDLIEKKGLEYRLNSEGSDLSGGEKQKIAASRVFFREPDVIIIDEGTSNLDADNEYMIKNNFFKYFKDRIIIIISHRFNNVKNCDKVIYLKNGKIEDIDTHDNLLLKHTGYKELYEKQN
jgi:ABC-type bacteriocin/lantibiotic exporter with double-glycine peptidase domain